MKTSTDSQLFDLTNEMNWEGQRYCNLKFFGKKDYFIIFFKI